MNTCGAQKLLLIIFNIMIELINHYHNIIQEYGTIQTSRALFISLDPACDRIAITWYVEIPTVLRKPFEFCRIHHVINATANSMFELSIPFNSSIANQYAEKECCFAKLKNTYLLYEYLWDSKTIINHNL